MLVSLSKSQQGAIVRTIYKLDRQNRKDDVNKAYELLAEVPELSAHIKIAIEALGRENAGAAKRAKATENTTNAAQLSDPPAGCPSTGTPRDGPTAAAPLDIQHGAPFQPPAFGEEVLEQGAFGWCSACSVAAGASSSLLAKYGIYVDAKSMFNQFLMHFVPPKAFWPDQYARQLGAIRLKKPGMVFDAWVDVQELPTKPTPFEAAARRVHQCAGFRSVVVVANVDAEGHSHAMTAIRWSRDNSIMCLNSWGVDAKETIKAIQKIDFVRGYFVDVHISRAWHPEGAQGSRTVCDGEPGVLPLWKELFP